MKLFFLTLQTVVKARLLPVVAACAFMTFISLVLLVAGVTWFTADFVNLQTGWLDTLVNWIVGIVTGVAGWFMLPSLMVLFAGVFQEHVIHKVESVYYPGSVRKEPPGLWPDLWHDVKFTLYAMFLNVMVLPFYLFGAGFLLSIALNSYLLGREFFESAAGYHIGKPAAAMLEKKYRKSICLGGLVFTLMTLVPLVNLLVPVFATVWMVHFYHNIRTET
jgi:CysZ protein